MSLIMDQLTKLDGSDLTLDEAKKEALRRAEEAVAELNTLGFSYSLTQRKPSTARGRRRKLTAGSQQEFSFP